MVTELDQNTFDAFVNSSSIVIVDCWAPWCGPCRRMGPIVEEVADALKGKVAVGKLNVDNAPAVSSKYGINAIPTLLIFKDHVLVEPLVGLRSKEDIISYVNGL
jgi:thioredoxin 1